MSEDGHVKARFRALDGWRGVCALLVALSHLPVADHLHRLPWVRGGGFYVDFFFVLSGFVIAHGYAGKIADGPAFGEFIWRRFARLWPLHMACFAALFALRLAMDYFWPSFVLVSFDPLPRSVAAVTAFLSNAALLQGVLWRPGFAVDGPSWSISSEFYTYLVFGLVCLATARQRERNLQVLAAAVLAVVGAAMLAVFSRAGMGDLGTWSIFRCLCEFFAGVLAWNLWRAGWSARMGGTFAEISTIVLVGLFIWATLHLPLLRYLSPVVFAGVVLVFANERGAASRALRSAPAEKLGRWSYSIYLTHIIVVTLVIAAVQFTESFDHGFAWIAVILRGPASTYNITVATPVGDILSLLYLLTVIALSAITYAVIEVPGQRIFGPARRPVTRPSPATNV